MIADPQYPISTTGSTVTTAPALPNAVQELQPPAARILPLHEKAGFLLIGSEVLAYRYQAKTGQLSITNRDGGSVFAPLSDDDARAALAEIQKLPR